MRARTVLLIAVVAACASSRRSRMYPAGTDQDDGYGDLAQKSALLRIDETDEPLPPLRGRRTRSDDPYGDPDGGSMYGGDPYGGPPPPPAPHTPAPPVSRFRTATGLTGAIVGTVTWRGARPAPPTTACGAISPGVRVAASRAGGVLVTIERVEVGRAVPIYLRPIVVGGTVVKRGCALAPALQILTPLPAHLAIHGDATEARLRITQPGSVKLLELQPAGRLTIQAQPGVTRIEADDGSLGAAYVVATNTPYYAITDDHGRFRIDELAGGTYDVTIWRPPHPTITDGKLVYGPPVIVHRTVTVDPVRPTRLDISLDRERAAP